MANWAKANWANSLLQFVFDTLPLNYIPKIKKRKTAEIYSFTGKFFLSW